MNGETARDPETGDTSDIVVHADAAGAAHLMREIVALGSLDAVLEEHDGHWQVAVRAGDDLQQVLATVREMTSRCIEQGRMEHATVCDGTHDYEIDPTSPQDVASLAA
jgi:hypothetical protein